MNKLVGVVIVALAFAGWAGKATAQGSLTNGYVCQPKNIGGEETRLFFRQQNGQAMNISPSATFPVVCPVVVIAGVPPYQIVMRFGNGGSATQNFACAMEEYDRNFSLLRSIGKSVTIPAGFSNSLDWSNLQALDPSSYFTVRCILPPKGSIGAVFWY